MWRLVYAWRRSTALAHAVLLAAVVSLGGGVALANHNFTDVPNSAFYHDYVDFLVENGITSGCGAGLYCPGNPVTRGQMAIFLERVALLGVICPADSVNVGRTCIDKYEASVWEVPAGSTALIQKIRAGTVTLAELQAGGFQRGATTNDYGPGCPNTGNGCMNFYAVSIAGVTPSRFINWFQAVAAARNAGKRLPTNVEWQAAALGTPEGAPCIVTGNAAANTGSAPGCISDVGAFDMVGNVWELVADWVPRSVNCGAWVDLFGGPFSDDLQCMAGAATSGGPGVLHRGGSSLPTGNAGPFAVTGFFTPADTNELLGFRAAR